MTDLSEVVSDVHGKPALRSTTLPHTRVRLCSTRIPYTYKCFNILHSILHCR